MLAMTVNYPNTEGSTFDHDYYINSHMPLCERLLTGQGFEGYILHGAGGSKPGSSDKFHARVELLFESAELMGAALAANGAEINGDVPNYTNVTPEVSFSEVSINIH